MFVAIMSLTEFIKLTSVAINPLAQGAYRFTDINIVFLTYLASCCINNVFRFAVSTLCPCSTVVVGDRGSTAYKGAGQTVAPLLFLTRCSAWDSGIWTGPQSQPLLFEEGIFQVGCSACYYVESWYFSRWCVAPSAGVRYGLIYLSCLFLGFPIICLQINAS